MKVTAGIALAGALAVATTNAFADGDDPIRAAVEARQTTYKDLGGAFKGITEQIKRGRIVRPMLVRYSAQLKELSQHLAEHDWFPRGSGPESGLETAAKAEIWSKPENFAKFRRALVVDAAKFDELVAAGAALDALKPQHEAVGKSCSGCHKQYREEKD